MLQGKGWKNMDSREIFHKGEVLWRLLFSSQKVLDWNNFWSKTFSSEMNFGPKFFIKKGSLVWKQARHRSTNMLRLMWIRNMCADNRELWGADSCFFYIFSFFNSSFFGGGGRVYKLRGEVDLINMNWFALLRFHLI